MVHLKIHSLQHLQDLLEIIAVDLGIGYMQGMIGFTQIPLAYPGREARSAEPPDRQAYEMAQ